MKFYEAIGEYYAVEGNRFFEWKEFERKWKDSGSDLTWKQFKPYVAEILEPVPPLTILVVTGTQGPSELCKGGNVRRSKPHPKKSHKR